MRQRLARHPNFGPFVVAAASLLLSAVLAQFLPLPQPQFHDEFSYLLAGDTFAHGRLTNPPHKFWKFFETFQVLQQPTYMSKYPPLQGMFLALGQVLLKEPILGVWISTAIACVAAWWAFRGFMPRRWATLGALLIATHPLILDWNWSYWGGAPAMIGGCLIIGATARMNRRARLFTGIALGLGMGILLNSRPFEGAVITLLSLILVLYRSHGRKPVVAAPPTRTRVRGYEIAIPFATITFAIALIWTGYYNHRVTGHATQFPYAIYEQQYAATPPLIWLAPLRSKPSYTHPVMRDYYLGWELNRYQQQRTLPGLIRALREKWWSFLQAYFASPVMIVPLIASILSLRTDRKLRRMLLIAVLFLPACFSGLWFFPHYTAPAAIVYFFLFFQGLRHMRAGWRGGRIVLPLVLVAHLIPVGLWISKHRMLEPPVEQRVRLIESLKLQGPKHLIFVRPLPDYYAHNDWVYNAADIDASPIVWARDMGDDPNRALIDYYPDRQIWMLEVGAMQMRLIAIR